MHLVRRGPAAARHIAILLAIAIVAPVARLAPQGLPDHLSDAEFWHMVTDFSEPDGYFRSENLLSNETGFQTVIPGLLATVKPGGVYFGVGPEQNFTYIVATQPALAFIIDIRHQNAVQHLLYKALIELSDNRADFLARLFSRPRPAGLDASTSVDSLFAAFAGVAHDSLFYDRTLAGVKNHLVKDHGFSLSPVDLQLLEHNLDAFYEAGPELSYNFSGGGFGGRGMPTYAALMMQNDNAGVHRSYLATEAAYRTLRDIEMRNLVVPLTGDFGGNRAIVTAGSYVRTHGAVVTVFYTSNVEQYLFQDGKWFVFAKNVATLPLDSSSTFIRSGRAGRGGFGGGGFGGGMRSSLLQSIQVLLKAVDEGRVQSYQDVLQTSHL
jgi:hypothetical protein